MCILMSTAFPERFIRKYMGISCDGQNVKKCPYEALRGDLRPWKGVFYDIGVIIPLLRKNVLESLSGPLRGIVDLSMQHTSDIN